MIGFQFNDGGRMATGKFKAENVGDCTTRAIAIAAEMPYLEVYETLTIRGKKERLTKTKRTKTTGRNGAHERTVRKYLLSLGWTWVPTMFVGQGCKVHLTADELPMGRLIVSVSKHYCAVIDRVVHDTYLDDRNGKRCVYGYFYKESQ